jgi:hypothetical protein
VWVYLKPQSTNLGQLKSKELIFFCNTPMGMCTQLALLVSNIFHTTTHNIMQYLRVEIINAKILNAYFKFVYNFVINFANEKVNCKVQLSSAFWKHIISMNILS